MVAQKSLDALAQDNIVAFLPDLLFATYLFSNPL